MHTFTSTVSQDKPNGVVHIIPPPILNPHHKHVHVITENMLFICISRSLLFLNRIKLALFAGAH